MSRKMDTMELENVNLLEKNSLLQHGGQADSRGYGTHSTQCYRKHTHDKYNPNKRLRTCMSDSSDHSVCIEKDLEEIKKSMEKIVKRDDIAEMVTNIIGN